ncbi:MAG: hypothetical protein QM756_24160 [Polyangiaceae bacterium]
MGLGLFACARPPSTQPLGGEEWVRPERVADRKAQGSGAESARAAPVVIDLDAAPVASDAPAAPSAATAVSVAPSKPGEVELKYAPLTQGSLVTLETHFKFEAVFGAAGGENMVAEASERIEVRVLDAGPEAPRELEVSYVSSKSSFKMGSAGGSDSDDTPNEGKRFRVRLTGDKPQVTRLSAGKGKGTNKDSLEDDEKGVVFDLGTVTGYLSLLRPHLPAKLGTGWKSTLSEQQLAKVFGDFESVKLDQGRLALRGRSEGKEPIAEFDCSMPVHFGRDGFKFGVELGGRCTLRTQDSRPVDVTLRGPLRLEASGIPGAQLTGSLEASVHHTYSR